MGAADTLAANGGSTPSQRQPIAYHRSAHAASMPAHVHKREAENREKLPILSSYGTKNCLEARFCQDSDQMLFKSKRRSHHDSKNEQSWTSWQIAVVGVLAGTVLMICSLGGVWLWQAVRIRQAGEASLATSTVSETGVISSSLTPVASPTSGVESLQTPLIQLGDDIGVWETFTNGITGPVKSIAEGSEGAFWFSADGGGTKRFDGVNWTDYTDMLDTDGMVEKLSARVITKGPDNSLWFSAWGNSVVHFDGKNWTSHQDRNQPSQYVDISVVGPNGDLWQGLWGGILVRFNGASWVHFKDFGPTGGPFEALAVAPNGDLWLSPNGDGGVIHFDGTEWTTHTEEDGLIDDRVRDIAVEPDGTLWFGTVGGASHFDGANWVNYDKEDGLVHHQIDVLAIGPGKEVWFGTPYGASRFDGTCWATPTLLYGHWIHTIAVDSYGELWFGVDDAVIHLVPRR